jgi:hypothetical protein
MKPWSRSDTFAAIALVVSIFTAVPVGLDVYHGWQKPDLQITLPTPDETIRGAAHDVGGTSQHMENLSADTDLWLVIKGDTKWYPISKIQVGANGTWSLPADLVRIGGPETVEAQRFELVVYGVDGQTSVDFSKVTASTAQSKVTASTAQSKVTASTAQGEDGGLLVLPSGGRRDEYFKEWVTRND